MISIIELWLRGASVRSKLLIITMIHRIRMCPADLHCKQRLDSDLQSASHLYIH